MTPAIHTWSSCNDQFGIGTRKAMEIYAGTWDRYLGLVKEVSEHGVTLGFFEKLQTETCLEETWRRENIRIIRSHKIIARILRPWGDASTQGGSRPVNVLQSCLMWFEHRRKGWIADLQHPFSNSVNGYSVLPTSCHLLPRKRRESLVERMAQISLSPCRISLTLIDSMLLFLSWHGFGVCVLLTSIAWLIFWEGRRDL